MENVFPVPENVRDYFRENYLKDSTDHYLQDLIIVLKNKGCSQMQTVFLFINEGELSFREANQIVLNSEAWR